MIPPDTYEQRRYECVRQCKHSLVDCPRTSEQLPTWFYRCWSGHSTLPMGQCTPELCARCNHKHDPFRTGVAV
jgi:hypothetical protein